MKMPSNSLDCDAMCRFEELTLEFTDLVDGSRIYAINACDIPSAPSVQPPLVRLIVNCGYQGFIDDWNANELLLQACDDVAVILRRCEERQLFPGFDAVCVCIIGHWRIGARRRIYSFEVRTADLPANINDINVARLRSLEGTREASQVDTITELLAQSVA
jgi:hypothetical protein